MVKQELPPLCIPVAGQDWNFAGAIAIDEGIEYLNGLGATFNQGRGCGRVSCSYNSAIYICADVSPETSLPLLFFSVTFVLLASSLFLDSLLTSNFLQIDELSISSSYVASYASDIEKYCTHCVEGKFCVTGGQEFDTGGYNIIVRSDSC
jgi:hypothetical protein